MKQNILDYAADEIVDMLDLGRKELVSQFKNTKPFRMEPVDPKVLYNEYQSLSPQDVAGYINDYGIDAWNDVETQMRKFESDGRRRL